MNENLLYTLQQQPDATFARTLRERLHRGDAAAPARRSWPIRRLAIAATIIAVAGGLFTVPTVRAYAESFLALFRVVNFVAVPVSSTNAVALTSEQLNLPRLLSDQVQITQSPGAPVTVTSPDAAAAAAGFGIAQPTYLPGSLALDHTELQGATALRATVDVSRLNQILAALSIRDLEVPPELDGQIAYVSISPAVRLHYRSGDTGPRVTLTEAKPPQIQLPGSLDVGRLGEIGLRILGLPALDAHRLAQQVDWSSTLLVPVPPNARSFQQIDINGYRGVAIEAPAGTRRAIVLWSTGDRVFALDGAASPSDLIQMAASIR